MKRRARHGEAVGQTLYAAAVEQARRPAFYVDLGVPDSANGRFELYSLHVILLLRRLKGGSEETAEAAQAVFDTYISSLDDALREQGVGDLSMAKKMRKVGEAFYGRVKSYDEALDLLPDATPLQALIGRTVCAEGGNADALTGYALTASAALASTPDEAVLAGRLPWPEVRP